ncbi:hypothetical protein BKA59DRAFT_451969 [Fusarium tricinctum]|uniref:Alpha-type protein kinase domain-containing protein n=1 Tax=Fusarium tricinctum TaxID=61284 RepID=A0A8K0WG43_9HYPO|nr:hypothetical protein BKA59DRAFT_451969 [Fusarium tricinctum]
MGSSTDRSASHTRANVSPYKGGISKEVDDPLQAFMAEATKASRVSSKSSASSSGGITSSRLSANRGSSLADSLLRASIASDASSSYGPASSYIRTNESVNAPSSSSFTSSAQNTTRFKDPTSNSVAYTKNQISVLKSNISRANAAIPSRVDHNLFRRACSVDVLFLIDTTYSMQWYIQETKNEIRSIIREVKGAFLNEANVRIAIVAYKDHNNDQNIEFLDFNDSVDEVHSFLTNLDLGSGADIPEDVLGGIQKAINASWKQDSRCLIHVADAPPHGESLHDLGESYDHYYKTGSEPHGLTHHSLIRQLVELKVNYALLRINKSTDRMAFEFSKVYNENPVEANMKLHQNNIYKTAAVESRLSPKSRATGGGPLFNELQLGAGYNALKHLVIRTIKSSISQTASHLSVALGRKATPGMSGKPALSAIQEFSINGITGDRKIILETARPRWDDDKWLTEKLSFVGFCIDLGVHRADTLDAMMDKDENIKIEFVKLDIAARPIPFAEGGLRVATYARPSATTSRFVLKSFKNADPSLVTLVEDMRIQAFCKAFAVEFNGLVRPLKPIDFVTTICLQNRLMNSDPAVSMSLEPFIEGEYVKYNSNGPYVMEDEENTFNEVAQAFSHFTFERSWGQFLVSDLQGVDNILTDPGMQTADPDRFKVAGTNIGQDGIKFFFALHRCKRTCRLLGLLSTKEMVISGNFTFREKWPAMDPTGCCSNKLCRRIIRLEIAKRSTAYPGCNWCNTCFPQLKSTEAMVACTAQGLEHMFQVSRFYHESQGETTPSVCKRHREKDSTKTAVVGGGLWNSIKSTKKTEISGRYW